MEGYLKYQFDDILLNDITRKRKHFVHNHLTFVVYYTIVALVIIVFYQHKGYRNVRSMHV